VFDGKVKTGKKLSIVTFILNFQPTMVTIWLILQVCAMLVYCWQFAAKHLNGSLVFDTTKNSYRPPMERETPQQKPTSIELENSLHPHQINN